jgi:hypothetical protein
VSSTKPVTVEIFVTSWKRQKKLSRPKNCATVTVQEIASPQETSDVPNITIEPVVTRSGDVQEDTTREVKTPDPPSKTLSKLARKKFNKIQR